MAFLKSHFNEASLRKMMGLDSEYITDLMKQIRGFYKAFFFFYSYTRRSLDIVQLKQMNF